jgi:hypothetical protein
VTALDRREVALVAGVALALLRSRPTADPSAGGFDAATGAATDAPEAVLDYDSMVGELRELMQQRLPAGTEVLVVSRGDDRLVAVPGLVGRHFPADPSGSWAGHHPALGSAANLVRDQRGDAAALVLPASAGWWLETYPEFAGSMDEGELLAHVDGVGWIWQLPGTVDPADPVPRPPDGPSDYVVAVGHLRQLVGAFAGAGEVVLVISRGDPALVEHPGLVVHHFPGDAEGAHLGHPEHDRHAIGLLRSAARRGARWLVIPEHASWWAVHYPHFWAEAHDAHTVVAHHDGVGTLIRLERST